jgi:cell wall-associated NlpC family hydrolase
VSGSEGSAGHAAIAVVAAAMAVPMAATTGMVLILGAVGGTPPPLPGCAGGGSGATVADVRLDAEQIGNARTVVTVTAGRHLPVYAAVVAVTTAFTESSLHNSTIHYDHDSEGLFQQRIRFYTSAVAADPVKATGAFLDRLIAVPNWQHQAVGVDAQAVQDSAYPGRYQPNAELGAHLVGMFWPAAAAAATSPPDTDAPATDAPVTVAPHFPQPGHLLAAQPTPTPTPTSISTAGLESSASPASPPALAAGPAVCPGGGGASAPGGPIAGPRGGNIAGTTTIPAGLIVTGSAAGRTAVRFALAQLGKPYVWAAAGPDAYDCSGLTMAAWAAAGVALPHHAADQAYAGTPEPPDLSRAAGGDLVMIPGSDGTPAAPGHVGMIVGYTQQSDGQHLWLIQAPETGVPVELTEASRWLGQISDVRHIG